MVLNPNHRKFRDLFPIECSRFEAVWTGNDSFVSGAGGWWHGTRTVVTANLNLSAAIADIAVAQELTHKTGKIARQEREWGCRGRSAPNTRRTAYPLIAGVRTLRPARKQENCGPLVQVLAIIIIRSLQIGCDSHLPIGHLGLRYRPRFLQAQFNQQQQSFDTEPGVQKVNHLLDTNSSLLSD